VARKLLGPDISRITDYLYISAWPEGDHADEILALNIRLILSMHWLRASKRLNRPPLQVLWLPTIDTPITPMPISTLRRGVEAALPVIEEGWGVLAHCRAGVHRSVAMASCVLIGMGHTADSAMHLVAERREVADPFVGYIQSRIRRFESDWNRRADGPRI
jgi:protein-tyrosine phosphatase